MLPDSLGYSNEITGFSVGEGTGQCIKIKEGRHFLEHRSGQCLRAVGHDRCHW